MRCVRWRWLRRHKLYRSVISKTDMLRLWLTLFKANTEEELAKIEELKIPIMKEAIGTYRQVSATEEFRQLERLRERTRNNEAAALGHARRMREAEGNAEGKAEGIAEGKAEGIAEGIAKGEAKGRAKGRAEGKAEGRAEGEAKTLTAIEELIKQGVTDPIEILKKIKSV